MNKNLPLHKQFSIQKGRCITYSTALKFLSNAVEEMLKTLYPKNTCAKKEGEK